MTSATALTSSSAVEVEEMRLLCFATATKLDFKVSKVNQEINATYFSCMNYALKQLLVHCLQQSRQYSVTIA